MTNNPLSREQKRSIFKELYTARCDNCHLAKSRTKFVFGAGNVDAPLLIIGEAPGAEEDREGLPFVGAAGKLLTTLFTGAGLERDKDTFITNVLKCRPPKNRNPESGEIAACLPLLEKQVRVIGPKIILLLGKIAAHAVLDLTDSILKMRRSMNEYRGIPVIVTYHPAAILRNPEYRAPAEEDFVKVARFLKKENHGAAH